MALKLDVVFLLHDAGETLCLMPLIERVAQAGLSYRVVALSFAAFDLLYQTEHVIDLRELLGLTDWPLMDDRSLFEQECQQFLERIDAHVLLAGCMRPVPIQLIQACQHKGMYCIAFYDAFDVSHEQPVQHIIHLPVRLWVPSQYILDYVRDNEPLCAPKVVGHSTLSTWREPLASEREAQLKAELMIDTDKSLVVFVGGYGDFYEQSFSLFLEVMQAKPDWQGIVLVHPGCGKRTEERLLANTSCTNVSVACDHYQLSEVAKLAALVVSRDSTANVQALFSGIPALYLVRLCEQYRHDDLTDSFFVNHGLLHRCFDKETFIALADIAMKKTQCLPSLYEKAGVPHGPLLSMFDDLMYCYESVNKQKKRWEKPVK